MRRRTMLGPLARPERQRRSYTDAYTCRLPSHRRYGDETSIDDAADRTRAFSQDVTGRIISRPVCLVS
jgi:hypothetical protein